MHRTADPRKLPVVLPPLVCPARSLKTLWATQRQGRGRMAPHASTYSWVWFFTKLNLRNTRPPWGWCRGGAPSWRWWGRCGGLSRIHGKQMSQASFFYHTRIVCPSLEKVLTDWTFLTRGKGQANRHTDRKALLVTSRPSPQFLGTWKLKCIFFIFFI